MQSLWKSLGLMLGQSANKLEDEVSFLFVVTMVVVALNLRVPVNAMVEVTW